MIVYCLANFRALLNLCQTVWLIVWLIILLFYPFAHDRLAQIWLWDRSILYTFFSCHSTIIYVTFHRAMNNYSKGQYTRLQKRRWRLGPNSWRKGKSIPREVSHANRSAECWGKETNDSKSPWILWGSEQLHFPGWGDSDILRKIISKDYFWLQTKG